MVLDANHHVEHRRVPLLSEFVIDFGTLPLELLLVKARIPELGHFSLGDLHEDVADGFKLLHLSLHVELVRTVHDATVVERNYYQLALF